MAGADTGDPPDTVRVVCNGVPGLFLLTDSSVICGCRECAAALPHHLLTQPRLLMASCRSISPTEFERHAGMGATRKWRHSIKVLEDVPANAPLNNPLLGSGIDLAAAAEGVALISIGRWLDDNPPPPRAVLPPAPPTTKQPIQRTDRSAQRGAGGGALPPLSVMSNQSLQLHNMRAGGAAAGRTGTARTPQHHITIVRGPNQAQAQTQAGLYQSLDSIDLVAAMQGANASNRQWQPLHLAQQQQQQNQQQVMGSASMHDAAAAWNAGPMAAPVGGGMWGHGSMPGNTNTGAALPPLEQSIHRARLQQPHHQHHPPHGNSGSATTVAAWERARGGQAMHHPRNALSAGNGGGPAMHPVLLSQYGANPGLDRQGSGPMQGSRLSAPNSSALMRGGGSTSREGSRRGDNAYAAATHMLQHGANGSMLPGGGGSQPWPPSQQQQQQQPASALNAGHLQQGAVCEQCFIGLPLWFVGRTCCSLPWHVQRQSLLLTYMFAHTATLGGSCDYCA